MRATTIRFTPELWALLQREAEREGVSVAQYVRDAALFRVAYSAGERSEQGPGAVPPPQLRQVSQR